VGSARSLLKGPHGPEPSWLHILEGPADSAGGLLNSTASAFVSARDLIRPSCSGNACSGCDPAKVLI
jgi:hypothetical protein